jgi:hypothetical protein
MRVRKFLFIDRKLQIRKFVGDPVRKLQIRKFSTIRQRELNIFLKKIPPFMAKLSKNQLQVCLAEFFI